jgi:TrmH family RNA methyltransferase
VLTKAELQRLRSLRDRKHRDAAGLFVLEGEKGVAELLATGFPLLELYATGAWAGPAPAGPAGTPRLRITRVTAGEMARISHFPTPSPVLAVGAISRPPLAPRALASGHTLALDGVQDAGNVGTLLRIADWFAFDRVLLSPECADVYNQKAINASMGSFARVPAHIVDLPAVLGTVPGEVAILGCDLTGDDVHTLPPLRHAIVVIGNEGHGLSPAVAGCLTRRITIPRYGRAESLNAAVAAAIVCDTLRRALA